MAKVIGILTQKGVKGVLSQGGAYNWDYYWLSRFVSDLALKQSDDDVILTWNNNGTVDWDYILIERKISGGDYAQIAQITKTLETYTDENFTVEGTYYYRIRLIKGTYYSSYCIAVSIAVSLAPDGSPVNLTATVDSDTSITLNWTIGSTNHDGHRIYISTDGVTFSANSTVLGATATKQVTGLTAGTKYWFYVKAYKGDLESAASNTVSAWAQPGTSPLVRYYFDAGSGTEVLDQSGNDYNITIPQDATTPVWGSNRLIFTSGKYLISPVLPITSNGAWTIMLACADTGLSGGATFSLGTRDSDWRYIDLQACYMSSAGGGISLPQRSPHSALFVIFITQDPVAGTITIYRPDTNESASRSVVLGSTTNVQLSLGIILRTTLYLPTSGCEIGSLTAWTKVLNAGELASEAGYEYQRLGNDAFPDSVDDQFDREDTALGSIGISTSGWRWDYRNELGWGPAPTKGQVFENKWIFADASSVVYAAAILKNVATKIGGTISFTGTTESSTYTQAFCVKDNWVSSMIHMNISPTGIEITSYVEGVGKTLLSKSITLSRGGVLHYVEAIISGNTLTVSLDGVINIITDESVSQSHGRYLFFEHSTGANGGFLQVHRMYAE